MKENIFSLELKYHVDEFEYQVVKFIDNNGNVRSVNDEKYFQLRENATLEDLILQSDFINFLENNCGVTNYSSVDSIDLDSNDDTVYVHYKKNTFSDQENIILGNSLEHVKI